MVHPHQYPTPPKKLKYNKTKRVDVYAYLEK